MLYKELLSKLLENQTQPTHKRCVLYLRFPADVLFSPKDPASLFAYIYAKQAESILFLEQYTSAILRHPTGLIAFFTDPIEGLHVGLKLMSQYLCISLDMGDGWIVEDEIWVGVARWKSEHLSHFVPANHLWAARTFVQQVQLPNGVGCFDGNRHKIQQIGFPYYEVKDYRDI